jgi:hypothetical protein
MLYSQLTGNFADDTPPSLMCRPLLASIFHFIRVTARLLKKSLRKIMSKRALPSCKLGMLNPIGFVRNVGLFNIFQKWYNNEKSKKEDDYEYNRRCFRTLHSLRAH